jgi:septal ring factor EnvC (AmiA/AmiB activator)
MINLLDSVSIYEQSDEAKKTEEALKKMNEKVEGLYNKIKKENLLEKHEKFIEEINFLKKEIKYQQYRNEENQSTSLPDLIEAIKELEEGMRGSF